jgi:rod shape-determining protein MreC
MELLLNRYRNLTVLVVSILAQLVLLAYQVKSNQDVRLIRVWAVSGVTPLARALEGGRTTVSRFFADYFVLLDVRDENRRMKQELNRIQIEDQYLRAELSTADRARALAIFQEHSPSKTVAAHIIGNSTGPGAKVVFVDRGSNSGIQKGIAVITPDGIVGKVVGVYPAASLVLLMTDPAFAAGVVSQKNHAHGTLKGIGQSTMRVDYVQNEQNVETGEWFYTSGDDGIFPKGLPAGQATVVRPGKTGKEIYVTPSGFQNGLDEVLIIVEGAHAPIPDTPPGDQPVHLLAPPADGDAAPVGAPAAGGPITDADRLLDKYRKLGEAQKHAYGERGNGAPNYNLNPDDNGARKTPVAKPAEAKPAETKPAQPKPPDPVKPTDLSPPPASPLAPPPASPLAPPPAPPSAPPPASR